MIRFYRISLKTWTFGDKTYWICESKWWETRKVGVKHAREFLELADKVKATEGHKYFPPEGPVCHAALALCPQRRHP